MNWSVEQKFKVLILYNAASRVAYEISFLEIAEVIQVDLARTDKHTYVHVYA